MLFPVCQKLTLNFNSDNQSTSFKKFSFCIFQANAPDGKRPHLLFLPNFEEPSYLKENVKRYSIREGNTLVFALSTVNIDNNPPVLYGFISFKFNSIDEESEQFKLLADCLIAKVEVLCYYIKVLESSYRLYPAAVYAAGVSIEDDDKSREYIDMAVELGEDLDFLRCIYADFISGGIDNDD